MLWIFRAISDRLKALFVADVALDFEAEFLTRQADRKADLFRKADQLEKEGRWSIASELRKQADTISIAHPLATVTPAAAELHADLTAQLPLLALLADTEHSSNSSKDSIAQLTTTKSSTKKGK